MIFIKSNCMLNEVKDFRDCFKNFLSEQLRGETFASSRGLGKVHRII